MEIKFYLGTFQNHPTHGFSYICKKSNMWRGVFLIIDYAQLIIKYHKIANKT